MFNSLYLSCSPQLVTKDCRLPPDLLNLSFFHKRDLPVLCYLMLIQCPLSSLLFIMLKVVGTFIS